MAKTVICSQCQKNMGRRPGPDGAIEISGPCEACKAKLNSEERISHAAILRGDREVRIYAAH